MKSDLAISRFPDQIDTRWLCQIVANEMNISTSIVDYYARRASEYERIFHKPERQADLQVLRNEVEGAFDGAHVFEVASGTGYWTEIVSRTAASVLATDINEEVLAIARTKQYGCEVAFQNQDAYAPRMPSRRITAGFSAFWWSHIPKSRLRGFLTGFHAVLPPGATVVFMDNVYVAGSSTPISRTDEFGDSFQTRRLDDGSEHEVLKNFPSESELRGAVADIAAGVKIRFLKYYWVLSYRLPEG